MAKSRQKLMARNLRKQGKSIKEITKEINVSPGSVSAWCRDIELTNNQILLLQQRKTDPYYGKRANYIKNKIAETNQKIKTLKNEGIKEVGKLNKRDIFLIGIALYWGEGFKKDNQVGLATSDPNMAKFFILWLNRSFKITIQDLILRVTANISYKNQIRNLEKYWSDYLNISITQFSKPFFQKTTWKKQYENKDTYHGVIRMKVRRSINLLRKIYGFIEGISLLE